MPAVKITIVEDDLTILQMYKYRLELEGFLVTTASDGQSGLQVIAEQRPHLALLDIKMPLMNGDEVLEKIRSTDHGADLKVIILTNISKDEAPKNLRFLHVDRYIVKAHHTPKQVTEIIQEVLGGDQ